MTLRHISATITHWQKFSCYINMGIKLFSGVLNELFTRQMWMESSRDTSRKTDSRTWHLLLSDFLNDNIYGMKSTFELYIINITFIRVYLIIKNVWSWKTYKALLKRKWILSSKACKWKTERHWSKQSITGWQAVVRLSYTLWRHLHE